MTNTEQTKTGTRRIADITVGSLGWRAESRSPTNGEPVNVPIGIGFTDAELMALHGAYRNGARGTVVVAVRRGERLLTIALPPVRSEEALYRQMREAAKRLRTARCDGWFLARRATARLKASTPEPPTATRFTANCPPVRLLLIQTRVRLLNGELLARYLVSPLDGGSLMFCEYRQEPGADERIVTLLSDASGQSQMMDL